MTAKSDTPRLEQKVSASIVLTQPTDPENLHEHLDTLTADTDMSMDHDSEFVPSEGLQNVSNTTTNRETKYSDDDLITPMGSGSVSLDSNLREVEGFSFPQSRDRVGNVPGVVGDSCAATTTDNDTGLLEDSAMCVLVSPEQRRILEQESPTNDDHPDSDAPAAIHNQQAMRRNTDSYEGQSVNEGGSGTVIKSVGNDVIESVSLQGSKDDADDSMNQTDENIPSMAVRVDKQVEKRETDIVLSQEKKETRPANKERASYPTSTQKELQQQQQQQQQIARLPSPKLGTSGTVKATTGNMLCRGRIPPKLIRLATVTVATRSRTPRTPTVPSLYYQEPLRRPKVISWDVANNARPPLRIDMEGPGPCSYSPRNKPLNETNAPSFTFGSRCFSERDGGSRTSWEKSWFQSPEVWTNKTDFSSDGPWPAPPSYRQPSLLGPRQKTATEAPSYSFGRKSAVFSLSKPGSEKEPSPVEYDRHLADNLILTRQPSFTHQFRAHGTVLWGSRELTPGPAAYSPKIAPSRFRTAFTIQGVRREKSQKLGPFSTF